MQVSETKATLSIVAADQFRKIECRLLYLVGQLGLGGLERQLFYLIRSMDRRRYKPVVAVWGNSSDDHYAQGLRELGVAVVCLGGNSSRVTKLRLLNSLVSLIQPEVIHSYTFHTNFPAWWASRGTKIIPIGSVRNNFIRDRVSTGKVLGRLCGRLPSAQIFNSTTAKKNAKQTTICFRPRRMYVVNNGVDLDRFSPRPHPERGYILAVGNLYPRKRWDRLVRAVALLVAKGVCPEVVHAGSGPLREDLERLAKELHVQHLLRFLGARHDITDLLADAAFLVHTADDEGCPNVIMEAMACGRAVVATDAGDAPYLIDHGKTGFVAARSDEAMLSNFMATLLGDHELRRRMGDAGRIKAERAFGIERLRSETFAVYRAEGWKDN